jgi:hypothetical protein
VHGNSINWCTCWARKSEVKSQAFVLYWVRPTIQATPLSLISDRDKMAVCNNWKVTLKLVLPMLCPHGQSAIHPSCRVHIGFLKHLAMPKDIRDVATFWHTLVPSSLQWQANICFHAHCNLASANGMALVF